MEIKFDQLSCRCLRWLTSQTQQRELTQEVRLPEAMPDISRVLGSWAQVLVRGKEWHSGGMTVSGGVMAWVMYVPEDGSEPRSVETWIPFQVKWDLPDTDRDGFICVRPRIKSLDARSTSARKLMVRANISLQGQAMLGMDHELYQPPRLPEDIQLLTNVYPMDLPVESGEKLFQIDEELAMPGSFPSVEKILHYHMSVQITEQKMMASRLVFKGNAVLHIMYCNEASLYSWKTEIPFAQFADLDQDHSSDAMAVITPIITNLEVEAQQGRLMVKAELAAQFVILDRRMVELTEDAYSPHRAVKCQYENHALPTRLDDRTEPMELTQRMNADAVKLVDTFWLPDHPQLQRSGDVANLYMSGSIQVLYYDQAGMLQSGVVRYEQEQALTMAENAYVDARICENGDVDAVIHADGIDLSADYSLDVAVYAAAFMPMVAGLEVAEPVPADPGRPSLILRRYDSGRLWDIAKENGSTVEAIKKANQLQNDPPVGQMLLIPIP